MTAEIIEAVRHRPELAATRLLVAGRLAEPGEDLTGFKPKSMILTLKRLFADVPGVQSLRHLQHEATLRRTLLELKSISDGRVVYHEPNMIADPFPGTTVVSVNDLSWHHHPDYHPAERLTWIERNLPRTLRQASRFVALSKFTSDAMVTELGIAREKIDIVPLAASALFTPRSEEAARATLLRYGLQDRGYVLSVSTLEPRKNFDRLAAAHAMLPAQTRQRFPLAIIGGAGWGNTLESPVVDKAKRAGELLLLGYLSDPELAILYSRAALFAYPSLYEGFGLPVIEAMSSGTAVLASSTTATGETAGDAAELVDPWSVESIADGLRRLLEDTDHNATLRRDGVAHAALYSWEKTAIDLIATWRRALSC